MSGKGNCFDNAPMESFWATLKQELVHHRHYRSRQEAAREITEYIELFYNRQRRHGQAGVPVSVYPRRMSRDSMPDYQQHERILVSTIYVRPHVASHQLHGCFA